MQKLFARFARGLVCWLRLVLGLRLGFFVYLSHRLVLRFHSWTFGDARNCFVEGRLSNMGGILDVTCFTLVLVVSFVALLVPRRFQLADSVGSLARTQSWS